MIRLLTPLLVFTIALPALAADRIEEFRCSVTDGMVVSIANVAGSVVITPWEKDEIFLNARLETRVEKVQVLCEDRKLDIQVIVPKKGTSKIDAHLELFIPESTMPTISDFHVDTVSADITLHEGAGDISLESISGNITGSGHIEDLRISTVSGTIRSSGSAARATMETISGDVHADGQYGRVDISSISGTLRLKGDADTATLGSTSGDITVEAPTRDLELSAVSGTLRASQCQGNVEGSTISGDIRIDGTLMEDIELGSVSGTISVVGTLHPKSDVEIESRSGDIQLSLPANTPASIEAETHSGDIRCNFPGARVKKPEHGPGSSLDYTHEAATCDIELQSFSGTIKVEGN